MATRGKLTLNGMDRFLERLAELGKNVNAAAAEALQAGGEVALDGMQERVRKDTHNLEDHLVALDPKVDGNFVFVEVGLIGADADTTRYGNAQEYGTSSMEGQSYIRATLDEDKAAIRRAIADSLKASIGGEG